MKKLVLGFAVMMPLAMTAMAAEWTGYISDAGCAKKHGASKVARADHAGCAESCLKKGDPSLLVFESVEVLARAKKYGDLFEPVLRLKQKMPPVEALQQLQAGVTAKSEAATRLPPAPAAKQKTAAKRTSERKKQIAKKSGVMRAKASSLQKAGKRK